MSHRQVLVKWSSSDFPVNFLVFLPTERERERETFSCDSNFFQTRRRYAFQHVSPYMRQADTHLRFASVSFFSWPFFSLSGSLSSSCMHAHAVYRVSVFLRHPSLGLPLHASRWIHGCNARTAVRVYICTCTSVGARVGIRVCPLSRAFPCVASSRSLLLFLRVLDLGWRSLRGSLAEAFCCQVCCGMRAAVGFFSLSLQTLLGASQTRGSPIPNSRLQICARVEVDEWLESNRSLFFLVSLWVAVSACAMSTRSLLSVCLSTSGLGDVLVFFFFFISRERSELSAHCGSLHSSLTIFPSLSRSLSLSSPSVSASSSVFLSLVGVRVFLLPFFFFLSCSP